MYFLEEYTSPGGGIVGTFPLPRVGVGGLTPRGWGVGGPPPKGANAPPKSTHAGHSSQFTHLNIRLLTLVHALT